MAVVAVSTITLSQKWPFTRKRVVKDLAYATSSRVEIRSFQQTFFPHPGCIAEGLTFRRSLDPQTPPLITIRRLIVQGTYTGLLTHYISVLRAEGMRIIVPPLGSSSSRPQATSAAQQSSNNKLEIGQMLTDDALLDFTSHNPHKPPIRFAIHQFSMQNWGTGRAMPFSTSLLIPTPPGEVVARGNLGPWIGNPAQAPVTGEYSFKRADLGVFKGIAGVLSSNGKFQGTMRNLGVQGATDVPAFELTRNHHRVRLTTQFRASVNATNGDVILQDVNAHFWNTDVISHGNIEGRPGEKGKTASLNLMVRQGRIQDLLFLIVRSPKPPLSGVVSLKADATIPPGQKPFLRKLQLQGDFGVDDARFTKPATQQQMDQLSERARGHAEVEDPADVVSDLKGHVVVNDGVAKFTNLSFKVPGADAEMHGTYDLLSQRVNLHGILRMQAKLSQATSGVKSFLVKALDPFLNNNRPGAPFPISITGTYHHPSYHVSSTPQKEKRASSHEP